MDSKELARLDALAKSLVAGRPIAAGVEYDLNAGRLTLHLRSSPGAAARRAASRHCSPTLMEHADLDAYVRRQVADFASKMED
jgi:hypothetical protein